MTPMPDSHKIENIPRFVLSDHVEKIDNLLKIYKPEIHPSVSIPSSEEILNTANSLWDNNKVRISNSLQILAAAFYLQFAEAATIKIIYWDETIHKLLHKVMSDILERSDVKLKLSVICADSFYGLVDDENNNITKKKSEDIDRISLFVDPKYNDRVCLKSIWGRFNEEEIRNLIALKIEFGLPIMNHEDAALLSRIKWNETNLYGNCRDFSISPDINPRELRVLPNDVMCCSLHIRGVNSTNYLNICKLVKFLSNSPKKMAFHLNFSKWDISFETPEAEELLTILETSSVITVVRIDTIFTWTKQDEHSINHLPGFKFHFNRYLFVDA